MNKTTILRAILTVTNLICIVCMLCMRFDGWWLAVAINLLAVYINGTILYCEWLNRSR